MDETINITTDNKIDELREITKIKNRKDLLKDRVAQINDILNDNLDTLNAYKESSVDKNTSRYSDYVEQMGTYIINSKDAMSCRELEYSFYENERRYRQYAIGRESFPVDLSDSQNTLKGYYVKDEYGLDIDESIEIDICGLDEKQLRRLVSLGMSEKDMESSKLKPFMSRLYRYTINNISEENAMILNLMIDKKNDREISEITKIPRRTINYRVGTILAAIRKFR